MFVKIEDEWRSQGYPYKKIWAKTIKIILKFKKDDCT